MIVGMSICCFICDKEKNFLMKQKIYMARTIATVLWLIWFARNKKLFKGKVEDPACAVEKVAHLSLEWRTLSRKPDNGEALSMNHLWKPPPASHIRISTDGAVFTDYNEEGLGIVARNTAGAILQAAPAHGLLSSTVLEVELTAINLALDVSRSMNWKQIQLETDCFEAVEVISNPSNLHPLFNLIMAIKDKLSSFSCASASHISSSGNHVAHLAARSLREFDVKVLSGSMPSV